MPINSFAKKLETDIYNAMKDPGNKTGEELSKLYFNTLAKSINQYLTANVSVPGLYTGNSPTAPPIPVPITITYKCNFNINGQNIRSEILKIAESLKDSNGNIKYNSNMPNVFTQAIYKELIKQKTLAFDSMGVVAFPDGHVLYPLIPTNIDFSGSESHIDTNRIIATGVYNMLNGAVIANSMPAYPAGNGSSTVPVSSGGSVVFGPIVVI